MSKNKRRLTKKHCTSHPPNLAKIHDSILRIGFTRWSRPASSSPNHPGPYPPRDESTRLPGEVPLSFELIPASELPIFQAAPKGRPADVVKQSLDATRQADRPRIMRRYLLISVEVAKAQLAGDLHRLAIAKAALLALEARLTSRDKEVASRLIDEIHIDNLRHCLLTRDRAPAKSQAQLPPLPVEPAKVQTGRLGRWLGVMQRQPFLRRCMTWLRRLFGPRPGQAHRRRS